MSEKLDALCGLYCGACKAVLACREGTVGELAKEWHKNPENVTCHGCRSDIVALFCRDCSFRVCAAKRGIDHCFECDEFPCEELLAFRDDHMPHHSIVVLNLKRMGEVGVKAWLAEQRQRWSCPECGRSFYWYDEACRSCGAHVKSSVEEEREIERADV